MKRWMLKQTKVKSEAMAKDLKIREATACILGNRGISTYESAVSFLEGDLKSISNPFLMKDMKKGLEIIKAAIKMGKKIVVYGDYDVDGVMSTTILYKALKLCGANRIYYIPHRQKEGYGLNKDAIVELSEMGVDVLFTCDNGIAAMEEITLAKERGMSVVVLDHHEPGFEKTTEGVYYDVLPNADAIINPKQRDCTYPFPKLCAGGIAYQFARVLLDFFAIKDEDAEKEFLALGAVATVCDIVELLEENRTIVKRGLEELQKPINIGLRMLLEETNLLGQNITEYHLGFVIGPCINASGRLESARMAVELFCEEEEGKARKYAKELIALNADRKAMTMDATQKAMAQVEEEEMISNRVLVLFQKEVHESIAGIVAGRIKDKYYRPTIVITQGEEMAKGSARSIDGYDVFQELFACRELFARFGGHAMAAGLSLAYENIEILRKRLNDSCTLTKEEMTPVLRLEKQLPFSEIDMDFAMEIKRLAPFGKGNPMPLFGSKNINVERFSLIGKQKNILRFHLVEKESNIHLSGISFDGFEKFKSMIKELYGDENCDIILNSGRFDGALDFVYTLEINTYRGSNTIQLNIKDFRVS